MFARRSLLAAVVLTVVGGAWQTVEARPPQITVGDFVVTRYRTPMMDRSTPLLTIQAGKRLTALDRRGNWILVGVHRNDDWVRGWIQVRNVRLRPDSGRSSITFDNQSGESALVRLVGPTRSEIVVSNGQKRSVRNVAAGHYQMLVRYTSADGYRYVEGEHFDIEASATTYSRATITLHPVVHGTYDTWPTSAEQFDAAAPQRKPQRL